MKDLVIARRFSPPWHDGIISYTKGLVDVLSHKSSIMQHQPVDVLSLEKDEGKESLWSQELERYQQKKGFRLIHLNRDGEGSSSILRALRWLRENKDYDNVHITRDGFGPFLISLVLKDGNFERGTRLLKHLFVLPVHSHWRLERNYFKALQGMGICPKLTYVYSCDELERLYDTKTNWVLPPAVDTDFYRPKKVSRSDVIGFLKGGRVEIGNIGEVLSKERIVLYMGPVTPDRFHLDPLLKSLFVENDMRSDTGLLVVGRSRRYEKEDFLERINQEVERSSLSDNVFLTLKRLTESQRASLYNLCDVFFYPFITESLRVSVVIPPIAILEVMASGTPVITGGLPALSEIIEDRTNGFLLEETTSGNIAEALSDALNGSSKKLSKNARDTMVANFSVKSVSEKLQKYDRGHPNNGSWIS